MQERLIFQDLTLYNRINQSDAWLSGVGDHDLSRTSIRRLSQCNPDTFFLVHLTTKGGFRIIIILHLGE